MKTNVSTTLFVHDEVPAIRCYVNPGGGSDPFPVITIAEISLILDKAGAIGCLDTLITELQKVRAEFSIVMEQRCKSPLPK